MTRIDRVLRKLSDLYEFNRKIKGYELKKKEEPRPPVKPGGKPRRYHR